MTQTVHRDTRVDESWRASTDIDSMPSQVRAAPSRTAGVRIIVSQIRTDACVRE